MISMFGSFLPGLGWLATKVYSGVGAIHKTTTLLAQMNCATELDCRLTHARIPPGCRTNTSGS